MSQVYLPFLLFLILSLFHGCSSTSPKSLGSTDFIKTSCGSTQYPNLCYQSLSIFRNKIHYNHKTLAQIALLVSLSTSRSAKNYAKVMARAKGIKGIYKKAMEDCVDNLGDSEDMLSQSVKEFRQMGRVRSGQSFKWHMSNIQTWASAALTDQTTCLDGFSEYGLDSKVKVGIKSRVVKVSQFTSNALALINRFADKPF